jgi:Zn-dependent alcohol dehydrogenase
MVIAIDGIDERLDLAQRMGADHLIDFRAAPEPRQRIEAVKDLTGGWVQRRGRGGRFREVIDEVCGCSAGADAISRWVRSIPARRSMRSGSAGRAEPAHRGSGVVRRRQPRSIDFLSRNAGRLPLDEVVVDYSLEQIEQAFADQDAGRTRRASLTMV